jgi:predicted Zn finger-like uncharacterized protein
MPVTIQCPNCQKRYTLNQSMEGKRVKCTQCGTAFQTSPTFVATSKPTNSPGLGSGNDPFPTVPAEFGRYRILKKIGQGGMGAVYLAEDTKLGRQVALKLPSFGPDASPVKIERFVREARSSAILNHSNICTVYDADTIDGQPFISMALIEGKPLEDMIDDENPMDQWQAAGLTRKIALALAHAHEKGIVHRDLKPANIMIKPDGEPVIMDFGLAKRVNEVDETETKLTQMGSIMGTPSYMSPEQVRGDIDQIGVASDIYSLGIIFFELLTGRTPYSGSMTVVVGKILHAPVPPVEEFRPDANLQLARICSKAISKEISDRYVGMTEFADAIDAVMQNSSSTVTLKQSDQPSVFASLVEGVPEKGEPHTATPPTTRTRSKSIPIMIGLSVTLIVMLVMILIPKGNTPQEDIKTVLDGTSGKTSSTSELAKTVLVEDKSQKLVSKVPEHPKNDGSPSQVVNNPSPPKILEPVIPQTVNNPPLPNNKQDLPPQSKTDSAPKEIVFDLGNNIKLEMVRIPKGKFLMGSPKDEEGRYAVEGPQHEVTLTKDFYLGKYEVTRGQFRRFVESESYQTEAELDGIGGNGWDESAEKFTQDKKYSWKNTGFEQSDEHPVVNVSWNDAVKYCVWLSKQTGMRFRLPTEAEWEYACRAGSTSRYSFGEDAEELAKHGNVADGTAKEKHPNWDAIQAKDGYIYTSPVGRFEKNAFGLYDMHGNVYEWCNDWYGPYPSESVSDPTGPSKGSVRVRRGGSWSRFPLRCRSANRYVDMPTYRVDILGFRLAVDPTNDSSPQKTPIEPAQPPKIDPSSKDLTFDIGNNIKLEMVRIPKGKFLMGSPKGEKGRNEDEDQHEVTISKAYYMGKYEVMQEQWEVLMEVNPSSYKLKNGPVETVSWEDCGEYIRKLNAKVGSKVGRFRLPTEAEWEYGCRAGSMTKYSFGDLDADLGDYAWYKVNSDGKTHTVGSRKPNKFGLYDMHGNVWEWCIDWYAEYPSKSVSDPSGPPAGLTRVYRGGSWIRNGQSSRSALREWVVPVRRSSSIGFRLVFEPDFDSSPQKTPIEPAQPPKIDPSSKDLTFDLGNNIKLEMVRLPKGKFLMGSMDNEKGRERDEGPQHEVNLTKDFYLGKYEVTQAQWGELMGSNPSEFKLKNGPVDSVSWEDCEKFIKKLNDKFGSKSGRFRLPTEAEWEYGCRAGSKTRYSFGDGEANFGDYGWYEPNSESRPQAVGVKKANAYSLSDMHGNVSEWCSDWYGKYPSNPTRDPDGPNLGMHRVVRGGSWINLPQNCRSAFRTKAPPTSRRSHLGFRLAFEPSA